MVEWLVAAFNFIKENSVDFLAIWGAIVTIASITVKLTPGKNDDKVWGFILNILNALSINPTKKVQEEVKKELDERNDDSTRSNLIDSLR